MSKRCKNRRGQCQATHGANYLVSKSDSLHINTAPTWGDYHGYVMMQSNLGFSTTFVEMFYSRSMKCG